MTLLLLMSVPIGISLGFATAITLLYTNSVPLIMLAQHAFAALDSFPLLAIPFFMPIQPHAAFWAWAPVAAMAPSSR